MTDLICRRIWNMLTTALLKDNSKKVLEKTYWMSFLACLIPGAISGTAISIVYGITTGFSFVTQFGTLISNPDSAFAILSSIGSMVMFMICGLFCTAIAMLFSNVMAVGVSSFFINSRKTLKPELTDLFNPFRKGYWNTVVTMFLYSLFIYLWSLLFIIPGFIKMLEYFMVKYIIAENPMMSYERAFDISKKTMNGEKGFLFELYLSFIGWFLLAYFTCGVGAPFLLPYIAATEAEYYTYLKAKAIKFGYATESDFSGETYNISPEVNTTV